MTTSKHIGYAGMFAAYRIEIPNHSGSHSHQDPAQLLELARANVAEYTAQREKLSRRAWRQAQQLQEKIDQYQKTADFLAAVVK